MGFWEALPDAYRKYQLHGRLVSVGHATGSEYSFKSCTPAELLSASSDASKLKNLGTKIFI